MFFIDLFAAIIVGLLLTVIFSLIFKRAGPWDSAFLFFIIVFLGTWSIGLWLRPIGPAVFGYYWITFLMIGILIAMIIAAAGPPNTLKRIDKMNLKSKEDFIDKEKKKEIVRTDMFFAGLILLFLLVIMLGYLLN